MRCQSLFPNKRSLTNGDLSGLIFNIATCIINLSANGSIIYAILRLRLNTKPCFMFYLSMSISDLLISLTLQPMVAYTSTLQDKKCTFDDIVAQVLAHSLCQFSGLMMMLIAVDRYFQMRRKNNWHTLMSRMRARLCIAACLGLCLILALISALSSLYAFVYEFQLVLSIANGGILVFVMLVYIRGYCHLRNSIVEFNTNVGLHVAKYIAFILVIMAVCYIPTFIVYPIYLYRRYAAGSMNYKGAASLLGLVSPLVIVNSFLSAMVLMNSSKEIRGFFKQRLDTLLCRTRGQVVSSQVQPCTANERRS